MSRRAIFLDKDGTLIVNVPYNADPAKVQLMPGADALTQLHDDYDFAVITNQAGVAHGYFAEAALQAVRERLVDLMRELSVSLSGFYYCPHHPDAKLAEYRRVCECRKPRPGLLQQAAADLDIDLSRSWFLATSWTTSKRATWLGAARSWSTLVRKPNGTSQPIVCLTSTSTA